MINLKQANAFLNELGEGEKFIFQTYTDNKTRRKTFKINPQNRRPVDPLARVLIGTFAEHKKALVRLSSQGAGIFVQVNEGLKRGKDHVTRIRAVFVDLDSPETSAESMQALQKYMPKPSIIVQSSKGKYHVYWKVVEFPVDAFKLFQKQLAITFASDPEVHNLDRVMRLPGFPHQKKNLQKTSAAIMGGQYTVQTLFDAAKNAPPMALPDTAPPAQKSMDAFGLDMSEDYVAPTVLEPGKRTGKLVAHIGKMVGDGYSAEAIREEILKMNVELCVPGAEPIPMPTLENEVLGCIDKFVQKRDEDAAQANPVPSPPVDPVTVKDPAELTKQKPEEEVYEQLIQENSLDSWLERFRYIEQDSQVIDTHISGVYGVYTLGDWKNKTQNIKVGGKALLSKKWLECPARQSFRDVVYIPKQKKIIMQEGAPFWNIYSPSRLVPVPAFDEDAIRPFMAHMEYFFPKERDRNLFLDWMAFTVNHPEVRIPWAPLLVSEPGAGKGFIYEVMGSLLGTHNTVMVTADRLESQFNTFLHKHTLVCIDEMHKTGKSNITDKLNNYISERRIEINTKKVQEKSQDIYCNTIIFSNNYDATVIREGDRRFWVHVIEGLMPSVYYRELYEWQRDSLNMSHLLSWCMARDLSKFNHAEPPPTSEAKMDMMLASRGDLESILKDAIEAHAGPFAADICSFNIVSSYICAELQTPLTPQVSGRLRTLWGGVSKALPNATTQIRTFESETRHRVRSIRKHGYWRQRTIDDIQYELTRSAQMLLNKKDVLPPKLKAAKR